MSKINDIKILESNINSLQTAIDNLDLDVSLILHETTEDYSKKYLQDNNLNDEYGNVFNVLEDLQCKINDIKCLLEKKVNELYKEEINNIAIVNK